MNCKEVARLVSESHDRRLSVYDWIKVRLHLAMCFVCRNFSKQIAFINKITRAAGASDRNSLLTEGGPLEQSLSPEAKSRIKNSISPKNR